MVDAFRRTISDLQRLVHLAMDKVHALDDHGPKKTVAQIALDYAGHPDIIAYHDAREELAKAIRAGGISNED